MSASAASAKHLRAVRLDANGNLDALIARHAAANNVPEDWSAALSSAKAAAIRASSAKGNYGLMQIKLATARAMGYRGNAAGLLDADTNMTYAVKYLAGAYHVAGGNTGRAVHYYAAGYYYAAKAQGRRARTDPTALKAFAFAGGRGKPDVLIAASSPVLPVTAR